MINCRRCLQGTKTVEPVLFKRVKEKNVFFYEKLIKYKCTAGIATG